MDSEYFTMKTVVNTKANLSMAHTMVTDKSRSLTAQSIPASSFTDDAMDPIYSGTLTLKN